MHAVYPATMLQTLLVSQQAHRAASKLAKAALKSFRSKSAFIDDPCRLDGFLTEVALSVNGAFNPMPGSNVRIKASKRSLKAEDAVLIDYQDYH